MSYHKGRKISRWSNFAMESSPKSAKAVATKALKIAKRAESRNEKKYFDQSTALTLMGPAGSLTFLQGISDISLGPAINQRIGNVVHPTSLHLRLTSTYNPLATSSTQAYRIIVFRNKGKGRIANVNDYLQANNYYSFKSIENRYDTTTLYDKSFTVTNDNAQRIHNLVIPLKGMPIYLPNATGVPEKNGIYFLIISNEPVLLESPFLEGHGRLYYKE